jgi:hypothetical protein
VSTAAIICRYYAAQLRLAVERGDTRGAVIWERNTSRAAAVIIGRGC